MKTVGLFTLSRGRFTSLIDAGDAATMGEREVMQGALFYEFSLETHGPANHLLRPIDRFVDRSDLRAHRAPFDCSTGRPSIAPELLIRMLAKLVPMPQHALAA